MSTNFIQNSKFPHLLLLVGSFVGRRLRGAGILDLLGIPVLAAAPVLAPVTAVSPEEDLVTIDVLAGLDLLKISSCLLVLFSSEPRTGRFVAGVAEGLVPATLLLSANFFMSDLPASPVFILDTAPPIFGAALFNLGLLTGFFLADSVESDVGCPGFDKPLLGIGAAFEVEDLTLGVAGLEIEVLFLTAGVEVAPLLTRGVACFFTATLGAAFSSFSVSNVPAVVDLELE